MALDSGRRTLRVFSSAAVLVAATLLPFYSQGQDQLQRYGPTQPTDQIQRPERIVGWPVEHLLQRRTLTEGRVTFWSRSRAEYWRKGDTSGHVQWVRTVALDCDGDALLVRVDQVGAACHTGERTCFTAGDLRAAPGEGSR